MNKSEIEKLERKNQNILITSASIGFVGSIAGVIYAANKGMGGWAKVGWFIAGGAIVGLPTGIISRSMIIKNQDKITDLKGATPVFASKAEQEQAASDACESAYDSGGATAFNNCRNEFIKNNPVG
jgi:hypothetical protein